MVQDLSARTRAPLESEARMYNPDLPKIPRLTTRYFPEQREIETLVNSIVSDQGFAMQFFRDLSVYGLREALIYLAETYPPENNPDPYVKLVEIGKAKLLELSSKKCARTACENTHNIVCRHTQSGQLYCPSCARRINEANPEHPGLVTLPM